MSSSKIKPAIVLFDLDGVLLQSGGYIAAMNATISFITDKLGLGNLAPDLQIHHLFEAQGISSEWDMTAICLAIIFEKVIQDNGNENFPNTLTDILNGSKRDFRINGEVDFIKVVQNLRTILLEGSPPAHSVFVAETQTKTTHFFPNLKNQPIFRELLGNSQDLENNQVTRLIQNFVIGSEKFQDIFHSSPLVETEPYLETFDKVLVSNNFISTLKEKCDEDHFSACILTARPSIPPHECRAGSVHFFPEAEMGIRLVGVDFLPHIGFGNLQSWAYQHRTTPFQYLKPHPLQALAAIITAQGLEECEAMELAHDLVGIGNGETNNRLVIIQKIKDLLPEEFELVIFEDIVNGLQAVRNACNIFQKIGICSFPRYYGIAGESSKQKTLRDFGAEIFDNVNEGFDYFLQDRSE